MELDLPGALANFLKHHRNGMPHEKYCHVIKIPHTTAYSLEYQRTAAKLWHVGHIAARLDIPVEIILRLPSARFFKLHGGLWQL